MRRALVVLLVMLVSVAMTPGVRELVLDLAHLVGDGHTAHVDECGDAHDEDEHGCTGPFHVCACHASMTMAATHEVSIASPSPVLRELVHARAETREGPRGHLRALFRPPTC